MGDYPDDADGDALRRVERDGADMQKPMLIDFVLATPNETVARTVEKLAGAKGYSCRATQNDDGSWDCICAINMLATHRGVLNAQRELDELARPHGARSDGWGTFGNG